MDGDGFDVYGSQPSLTGPGLADLNLNLQASMAVGFSWLGLYGAIL
jgi:hypothetical protein